MTESLQQVKRAFAEASRELIASSGGCLLCRGRTRACFSCHGRAWDRLHTATAERSLPSSDSARVVVEGE